MQFIPSPDFVMPHPRVQAKLYDALEAMRVLDAKLDQAIEEIQDNPDHSEDHICEFDLTATQATARLHASILQEIIAGTPTLSNRVFHAIRDYPNLQPENAAHVEGAFIALELAHRSLEAASDLSYELDGEEINEVYQLVLAAQCALDWHKSVFEGYAIPCYVEEALDTIIEGKPITLAGLMRRWKEVTFPRVKAEIDAMPA